MITAQEYLKAKEIVEKYEKQQSELTELNVLDLTFFTNGNGVVMAQTAKPLEGGYPVDPYFDTDCDGKKVRQDDEPICPLCKCIDVSLMGSYEETDDDGTVTYDTTYSCDACEHEFDFEQIEK
jgi:hypothetical protein